MLGYTYIYTDSYMSSSETRIHDLFNGFAKELYDREWEMSQEINNWSNLLIGQIEEHARRQKTLLNQEYRKQESYLSDTRQQFLNAVRQHEQKRDNEQTNQLLQQCKILKFELAALEFPERTIPFIQFMTEEQLAQKNQNERNAEKKEDKKSRNKPGGDHDNYNGNNTDVYGSSPSKSTSTTPKQTDRQGSTTTSSSTDYNGSKRNKDNSDHTTKDNDDLISKCPTCFMIFPLHMTSDDRNRHANEHFKDTQ